jgi:hypothetical protein
MAKPDFTPKETYLCRDTEVSIAAVQRWAGYQDRIGWWDAISNSDRFWFVNEYLKQRGKRNK